MLAEKRNDLAQMEKDLRFVIAREPDNAMALNALGYTWPTALPATPRRAS